MNRRLSIGIVVRGAGVCRAGRLVEPNLPGSGRQVLEQGLRRG